MSEAVYLVVERETGFVVNAVVGRSPSEEGHDVVRRYGKASGAWVGWTRAPDGSFVAPEPPPRPSQAETEA